MNLKKEDSYVSTFMGSKYVLEDIRTVADLKQGLQKILSDLPEDDSLEISEFVLHDGKLDYTLKEGIVQ